MSRSTTDRHIEDTLLKGLASRSKEMSEFQEKLLQRLRPQGNPERETFIEWVRSVVMELPHDAWRRCQKELNQLIYRYIEEGDRYKQQQEKQVQVPLEHQAGTSQCFTGRRQPAECWQPPPQVWPQHPVGPQESVWGSQDPAWVAHQFSDQQLPPGQPDRPQSAPNLLIRQSTPKQGVQDPPPQQNLSFGTFLEMMRSPGQEQQNQQKFHELQPMRSQDDEEAPPPQVRDQH